MSTRRKTNQTVKADTDRTIERFDMKIYPDEDEREQVVAACLGEFKEKNEASKWVKMLIYQAKTGRDWYTRQPLQLAPATSPIASVPAAQEASSLTRKRQVIFNTEDLDALDQDLSDWGRRN